MPVPANCAYCGAGMNLPDSAAGKRVRCPSCDAVNVIYANAGGGYRLGTEGDEVATIASASPSAAPGRAAMSPEPRPVASAVRKPSGGGDGTTIFVLGLLSIILCQILGPIAWIMGNSHRAACRRAGVEPDGLATGGWVMGIIATGILAFSFIIILFVLVLGMAGAAAQ
ncbi:MAG: DUF4190 domain-containing protein [Planctomycetota bacterium]